MQETSQNINEIQVANDNVPVSVSWKGALYDAVDKMDIAPEVQERIDATESFLEKFLGISFWRLNPWERVKILDMRRHPEEYMDVEALPILKRIESIVPANENATIKQVKKAA